MKIFSKLMSLIFHRDQSAVTATPANPEVRPNAPAASPGVSTAVPEVDITKVLDELAAKSSEDLDWRKSIVDLMKLVGMDSSFANRRELAAELGYTGSTSDSVAMNIWLHKAVMKKLAENGGKVPPSLLD